MLNEIYMVNFVQYSVDEEGHRDFESREESSVLFTSRPMIRELTNFVAIPTEINREVLLENDMMYRIGDFEVDIRISTATIIDNTPDENVIDMET